LENLVAGTDRLANFQMPSRQQHGEAPNDLQTIRLRDGLGNLLLAPFFRQGAQVLRKLHAPHNKAQNITSLTAERTVTFGSGKRTC
jgi:hypothetical protein